MFLSKMFMPYRQASFECEKFQFRQIEDDYWRIKSFEIDENYVGLEFNCERIEHNMQHSENGLCARRV